MLTTGLCMRGSTPRTCTGPQRLWISPKNDSGHSRVAHPSRALGALEGKQSTNHPLDNFAKFLDHLSIHAPDHPQTFVERLMKRRNETPRIYLASSGAEEMPVVHTEERLLSLLATLEECRDFLTDKASPETARLLSLAILELRMELHQVTDAELKALCDLMTPEERPPQEVRSVSGKPLPPYLKLVK